MITVFLKIYDYLRTHRNLWWTLLVLSFVVMIWRTLSLTYKEDIYDFLPVDVNYRKSLGIYQNISSADKIFVIFKMNDGSVDLDYLSETVDRFAELLTEADTLNMVKSLTAEIDYERFMDSADEIYRDIPYLLTEEDYARIDSLLTEDYVREQIRQDKSMLMLPTGSLMAKNISKDPLNIFMPAVSRLQNLQGTLNYDMYDGHIFSPDNKMAIAIVSSPFGSSETAQNSKLLQMIEETIQKTEAVMPEANAHTTGAPAIAVGNASRIKTDSIIAVAVALILILALLYYTFRNLWSILLIALSILWGALFAMSGISFIHSNISVIVLGIASVIIGIAVNYPLHLIAHLKHASSVRETLREIVTPLLIGNITTVGAFLCLVPLKASALQDLGIFGAFVLIGTIIFVLLFLPHIVGTDGKKDEKQLITERISSFSPESKRGVLWFVLVATVVLGYFSLYTTFDTDMQHINYMTEAQKSDFASLQGMMNESAGNTTLYIVSEGETLDEAVGKSERTEAATERMAAEGLIVGKKSMTSFIPSCREQERRLELWNNMLETKGQLLGEVLDRELVANGFNVEAFGAFRDILDGDYSVVDDRRESSSLLSTLSEGYVSRDDDGFSVVEMISVPDDKIEEAKVYIAENMPESFFFNIKEMNSAITNTLSDEFNYIGFSCGLIVFLFLWLSFGRLELSLLAFLPMMISWIWILGLMGMADIRFNIVNIILATFIFGQGDDYTIFITEGLIYEHTYKRKMLASYKNSIIISALIMFIGIGSLIVAKHPALLSLAHVTIVGMFSVVFMAYLLPPFIFKFLTRKDNMPRRMPLTLDRIAVTSCMAVICLAETVAGYFVGLFGGKGKALHRYISRVSRFNMKLAAGVKLRVANLGNTDLSGCTVVCNRMSALDFMLLMSLSPKMRFAVEASSCGNRFVGYVLRHANLCIADISSVAADETLVIFADDERLSGFNGEVIPIMIHGTDSVMPSDSSLLYRGYIDIEIGNRIACGDYGDWYANTSSKYETAEYYSDFVLSRYLYKGIELERGSRRLLKRYGYFAKWVDADIAAENIAVINNGNGELGMLFALVHKDKKVYAFDRDDERVAVAQNCDYLPSNLFTDNESSLPASLLESGNTALFILEPSDGDSEKYAAYNPVIIA